MNSPHSRSVGPSRAMRVAAKRFGLSASVLLALGCADLVGADFGEHQMNRPQETGGATPEFQERDASGATGGAPPQAGKASSGGGGGVLVNPGNATGGHWDDVGGAGTGGLVVNPQGETGGHWDDSGGTATGGTSEGPKGAGTGGTSGDPGSTATGGTSDNSAGKGTGGSATQIPPQKGVCTPATVTARFSDLPISVCFDVSIDGNTRTIIRTVVESAWTRPAGITFVGWDTCVGSGTSIWVGPESSAAKVSPNEAAVRIPEGATPQTSSALCAGISASTREACVSYAAVRGFGIALGLPGPGAPDSMDCVSLTLCPAGDVRTGGVDPHSITNGCSLRTQQSDAEVMALRAAYATNPVKIVSTAWGTCLAVVPSGIDQRPELSTCRDMSNPFEWSPSEWIELRERNSNSGGPLRLQHSRSGRCLIRIPAPSTSVALGDCSGSEAYWSFAPERDVDRLLYASGKQSCLWGSGSSVATTDCSVPSSSYSSNTFMRVVSIPTNPNLIRFQNRYLGNCAAEFPDYTVRTDRCDGGLSGKVDWNIAFQSQDYFRVKASETQRYMFPQALNAPGTAVTTGPLGPDPGISYTWHFVPVPWGNTTFGEYPHYLGYGEVRSGIAGACLGVAGDDTYAISSPLGTYTCAGDTPQKQDQLWVPL